MPIRDPWYPREPPETPILDFLEALEDHKRTHQLDRPDSIVLTREELERVKREMVDLGEGPVYMDGEPRVRRFRLLIANPHRPEHEGLIKVKDNTGNVSASQIL